MLLRTKLAVVLIFFVAIPLAISQAPVYYTSRRIITQKLLSEVKVVARFKKQRIEIFWAERRSDLLTVREYQVVKNYLSQAQSPELNRNQREFQELLKTLDRRMVSLGKVYDYEDVLLVSREGKIVYCSNPAHRPE